MTKNPYAKYKVNQIKTSSPEDLLLHIFNGIVKYMRFARASIEKNDYEKANDYLLRTQMAFILLYDSLDTSAWKEGERLKDLYLFLKDRLVKANVEKNVKYIDEILPIVQDLRDGWKQAVENYKNSKKKVASM